MHTQNVNIKTAAAESTERWDVKACQFKTQDLGRFSVKFSAPCVGGGVTFNCSHITNARNPYDAVYRFVRETRAENCTVYAVEQTQPVRPVCLSTTGYRFVPKGNYWLCLDNSVIVNVSQDGSMRRGDDGRSVPGFGSLIRI